MRQEEFYRQLPSSSAATRTASLKPHNASRTMQTAQRKPHNANCKTHLRPPTRTHKKGLANFEKPKFCNIAIFVMSILNNASTELFFLSVQSFSCQAADFKSRSDGYAWLGFHVAYQVFKHLDSAAFCLCTEGAGRNSGDRPLRRVRRTRSAIYPSRTEASRFSFSQAAAK